MLMYCDLWTKWSKIEQQTSQSTAYNFTVLSKCQIYGGDFVNFCGLLQKTCTLTIFLFLNCQYSTGTYNMWSVL